MFHDKGLVGDIDRIPIFSEMIKNVHVFLVKAVNSLALSHLGPPTKNILRLDCKLRMEH